MGSIFKRIKKTFKKVTKPLSKMTKGIARGIAKVGKAVMKGVGKINQKFGPLGSIALAMAMPYAMQGLGAGWTKAAGMNNPFGTFLKSVGKLSTNGYNRATGFISNKFNGITTGMRNMFSSMGNKASQSNIWKSISNGAKNLYTNAKKYTPKFGKGTSGSVDVLGLRTSPHTDGLIKTAVKSGDAMSMLKSGVIDGSQLSGQSLGSKAGWITEAGSSGADDFITKTINATFDESVGNSLSSNTSRHLTDVYNASINNGTGANKLDVWESIKNNKGITSSGTADGSVLYETDLLKTGDYVRGTARDRLSGESGYVFNGNKSFDNPVAKSVNAKKYITKKNITNVGAAAVDSLFKRNEIIEPQDYEMIATQGATSNDGYAPITSATNIAGATGSSNYAKVFGDVAWHKLKAYHKNMNYLGSI